jgi:hypothetical protein
VQAPNVVDSGPKASTEQIPAGRRCSGNGWATFPGTTAPDRVAQACELEGIGRLTLLQSLSSVRLVLWDEDQKRLVSFRELRRQFPSVRRRLERDTTAES